MGFERNFYSHGIKMSLSLPKFTGSLLTMAETNIRNVRTNHFLDERLFEYSSVLMSKA